MKFEINLYVNPVPSINRNIYKGQTTKIYGLSYFI